METTSMSKPSVITIRSSSTRINLWPYLSAPYITCITTCDRRIPVAVRKTRTKANAIQINSWKLLQEGLASPLSTTIVSQTVSQGWMPAVNAVISIHRSETTIPASFHFLKG
jgi:hypothetical protein